MKIEKYLSRYASLINKNVLVTGANSGIGYSLCEHLLFLNANVYMACRNIDKANKAKAELLKKYPNGKIEIVLFDQASFLAIDLFYEEIKDIEFFGFINNAGVYYPKKKMFTKDNFELTIGTNYLGQYYLLEKLEDKFIKDNTRVIVVSSLVGYLSKKRHLGEEEKLSRNQLYSFSKYLVSSSIYERMEKRNIEYVLVHPGICATNILNGKDTGLSSWFSLLGRKFLNIFLHSSSKASLCLLEGLCGGYQDFSYIAPRGIFALSGFPKRKRIPNKFKKNFVLEETKNYIREKKDVIN